MDDHEVRLFRTQMKLLQRRLRREMQPAHGLSRTALQVLTAVERSAEPPQPRQLAEATQMTSSNVAAALRELEAADTVERRRHADDARRVEVLITAHGRAVVAHVRSERDSWLGRAVESLLDPGEQRTLLAAGALMQRLAEFEPGSAGPRPEPAGPRAERERGGAPRT